MMAEIGTGDRAAGIALIGAAAASMLAMAHHPTSPRAGALIGIVHGAMILFAGLMTFGFPHFARLRGLARPAVLAGLGARGVGGAARIRAGPGSGLSPPGPPP